jgi:hypothetical protein
VFDRASIEAGGEALGKTLPKDPYSTLSKSAFSEIYSLEFATIRL